MDFVDKYQFFSSCKVQTRMRLSVVLISISLGLVSAKGDLNDFNTDKQSIAPERIAAFYSDIVIKGE